MTVEKLLDRNTRDRALTAHLLLQGQWAYTGGKSSKTKMAKRELSNTNK